MRSTTSFLIYATFLVLLSTFTAAWPWPSFFPEIDSLIVRADDNQSSSETPSETNSKATQTPSSGQKGSSTVSPTKGSSTSAKSTKSTKSATHTSYDARLPAGGITLLSPASTSALPIFKIGDKATFGFNFTSLSATPTALNILATCTLNQALYTIAMNQTINSTATTQQAIWDSNADASSSPLVVATYTLIIYDSDGSESDVPEAGYLAPFKSYAFGMYNPQDYTDDAGGVPCISCSGAFGSLERNALGFMFGMSIITVLTFTWFVNGLDVIW
ncbi:hypothetical protein V502_04219 [Pseudogymnoascus sp. VKM F-4520 (FW-2644)]|nr:hypothetical protein V502_04219 [Pseudogymnoascus sp. VKM F-4520 (FW-2644)]